MGIKLLLVIVLSIGVSSGLHADEYPVAGVWAEVNQPTRIDVAASCESYLKNPKAPKGHIAVFKGSRRTDFNGGYLEEETVNNIAVRKGGPNEFLVIDNYYDDGEGGGRAGLKRRSYKLRLLSPDKIEVKEGNYPSSQFMRCPTEIKSAGTKSTGISEVQPPTSVAPDARTLPKRTGECVETSISAITDRFGQKLSPSPSKDGFDPGTAIKYANGGFQISYDKEAAIIRSSIGDKVKMCLVEIPKDCPPGDDRGRVYNTKNLRTGEAWTLPDAQHRCGGA
jgi:hypothetical protein